MPELRRFKIVQTREVEVTANSSCNALLIATVAFENGQTSDNAQIDKYDVLGGVYGTTLSPIKEISIEVHRI